ncbi:hypothetical protein HMI55_004780 [Coelomomyces lativittatus]|nr:hypothetical protein HMI55_004780 [Coelomomyces lativittatus]
MDPSLHWSMYFPVTCLVRMVFPYSMTTASMASLGYVLTYLFQPSSPSKYSQVARCIYGVVHKYQEILCNPTRRHQLFEYLFKETLDSKRISAWDTMVQHFFVGSVPWEVLLSILDYLVLAYDPIETWLDVLHALIQCQVDQPEQRWQLHRSHFLTQMGTTQGSSWSSSSSSTWIPLPLESTEMYEQLANQVAFTPMYLHQLMQRMYFSDPCISLSFYLL